MHTDVRRTIRRRRWRARWMVDNALEPRLTWKLIVGGPNGTRRTFERSWMALCMIPRPTEGHTTKGCGRWAAIVVRRLPRELALLRGGLRASCETEHPDEEHTIADFIVWAVGATLDVCAPRRSRISEDGDGAIHISVVSRKDTQ